MALVGGFFSFIDDNVVMSTLCVLCTSLVRIRSVSSYAKPFCSLVLHIFMPKVVVFRVFLKFLWLERENLKCLLCGFFCWSSLLTSLWPF